MYTDNNDFIFKPPIPTTLKPAFGRIMYKRYNIKFCSCIFITRIIINILIKRLSDIVFIKTIVRINKKIPEAIINEPIRYTNDAVSIWILLSFW